jgi:hypothetical protein
LPRSTFSVIATHAFLHISALPPEKMAPDRPRRGLLGVWQPGDNRERQQMKNIAILFIVGAFAGSTILCQFDRQTETRFIAPEQYELVHPDVKQRVAAARCLNETMEAALQSLEGGDISLLDAARRVHDAAQLWKPAYLEDIKRTEVGQTPLERVARNLIGHMQNRARMKLDLADRIQELEAELEVLVNEMEESSAKLTAQ